MYNILGSESKEKILDYLAANPYKKAKEMSDATGVGYKHTFKIIKEFKEKGMVFEKNKAYYLSTNFIQDTKRFSDTLLKNYSKELFFKNKFDLYNVLSSSHKDDKITKKIEKIMDEWIMKKLHDWYSKYYDPKNEEYLELKEIIKISPKKNKILEVGCGTGRLTFKLAQDFKKIVAIDEEKGNIDFCKKGNKVKNVEFITSSAKDFKSKEKFDTIIFSWIGLHYHENYREIIENIMSVTHKDSTIIIMDAYPETEYIKILDLVRKRDMSESKKMREEMNDYLIKNFSSFEQKALFTEYHFPSIEELINNFKIELTLEESHLWTKEDEEKIRKYLEKKKNPLVVQEGLWLSVIKR